MTFSNICGRISATTLARCCLPQIGQAFVAYPHRPMTLHSPTENSLAVLKSPRSWRPIHRVQNVKLGGHQTCLSINRLWHELCDMLRRLVGTTAPGHHDCSIQNEKVSNHGSIPITIDCNVVAFIVFEDTANDSTSP
ncbi:hypothetical protein TNCV_1388841 [Trichonephila clavipes]|nr:hypothetical protein TNCV_1388841 [Trichonephila clavipes]